ncbi:MAG: phage tail sheath C-terminal domain-containing protein [Ginsengibacter sp.]
MAALTIEILNSGAMALIKGMEDLDLIRIIASELPQQPTKIVSVQTAIPAFIGYTEKAQMEVPGDLHNKPIRINSLYEYEQYFGYPSPETGSITVSIATIVSVPNVNAKIDEALRSKFLFHYSMQLYFANGGGLCWIISVGDYTSSAGRINAQNLKEGLEAVGKVNEVTLLLFPDAVNLDSAIEYYDLYSMAIAHAAALQDRFVIMDVYHDTANGDNWDYDINGKSGFGGLRNLLSNPANDFKYAASYFPRIYTSIVYNYKIPGNQDEDNEALVIITGSISGNLAELKIADNEEYLHAKHAINSIPMLLPASPAIAGCYVNVDKNKGVWNSPAGSDVSIDKAMAPQYLVSNAQQDKLNVDLLTGKSINTIRKFPGHGPVIVWGARTFAGNSNEWKYIFVCRYFIMIQESVKKTMEQLVHELNDRSTWLLLKEMINNYLIDQWRSGALKGSTAQEAYFVQVGLGQTMTDQDIEEGRLVVQIGLAMLRPAEFVILRLATKMLPES